MGNQGSPIIDNEGIIKIWRDKIFAYALCVTYPAPAFLDHDE